MGEWIDARRDWADRYGWPDGEPMTADENPPAELVDFRLWCDRRGVRFHLVGGEDPLPLFAVRQHEFGAWCAERARFAGVHGWHGGRDVRRREEVSVEPFDLSAL